jgi:membrane protein DedA with SNARE-associated domain
MDWMVYIENMIITSGALGVFWGSVLEEVIVFIPSSLVQAGAGFFLLSGNPLTLLSVLKLFALVVIPATVGVVLGSLPVYFIFYYGGYPALKRWGKYFLIKESYLEKAEKMTQRDRHVLISMALLRIVPIIPSSVASALSGLIRMRFIPYVISTAAGVFVRALYLGIVGWVAGAFYKEMVVGGNSFVGLGLIELAVVILIVLGIFISRYAKKRHRKNQNND